MRDFYRVAQQQSAASDPLPIHNSEIVAHNFEKVLATSRAALEVSERGRSAFLSSMNHELRTPLNAIMGFSEMIKTGACGPVENETYAEYAGHIHDSGRELLSKISDLISIANIDAGSDTLDEDAIALQPMLRELIEVHSHEAFDKQITLRLDCPKPVELLADRPKLLCALSHFLSNALRHSRAGSEITIGARVTPDDGLILSVRDSGEGIPPGQLKLIREAMQGSNCYLNLAPGSIGLGLALSHELANCHGGRIMVDSIRHRGTVVSLILPPERVLKGMPVRKGARTSF